MHVGKSSPQLLSSTSLVLGWRSRLVVCCLPCFVFMVSTISRNGSCCHRNVSLRLSVNMGLHEETTYIGGKCCSPLLTPTASSLMHGSDGTQGSFFSPSFPVFQFLESHGIPLPLLFPTYHHSTSARGWEKS